MATITKATKEAAPKAAEKASKVMTAKKTGAEKSAEEPLAAQEPTQGEESEMAKGASKESSQHMREVTDPEIAAKPTMGTAPQAVPAALQDQRWQEIKVILEKLKEDTLREIRKSVKSGTEAVAAIEPSGDIYDQASSERDRELGLLLGDREREKIHSIDEALLRISEGDYGICEECDEDIPLGRLKAMPFARHCVKCKTDLEKMQAQTKRVEEERAYREIPVGSEDEE
jgi:DnaK suppressor protein